MLCKVLFIGRLASRQHPSACSANNAFMEILQPRDYICSSVGKEDETCLVEVQGDLCTQPNDTIHPAEGFHCQGQFEGPGTFKFRCSMSRSPVASPCKANWTK